MACVTIAMKLVLRSKVDRCRLFRSKRFFSFSVRYDIKFVQVFLWKPECTSNITVWKSVKTYFVYAFFVKQHFLIRLKRISPSLDRLLNSYIHRRIKIWVMLFDELNNRMVSVRTILILYYLCDSTRIKINQTVSRQTDIRINCFVSVINHSNNQN